MGLDDPPALVDRRADPYRAGGSGQRTNAAGLLGAPRQQQPYVPSAASTTNAAGFALPSLNALGFQALDRSLLSWTRSP
jgi:hypothetical protein